MTQTYINPQGWSLRIGYSQAACVTGAVRQVYISGQVACDDAGAPLHSGDMRAQMQTVMSKIQSLISAAEMDMRDIVKMQVYSTDVEATLKEWDVIKTVFDAANMAPAMTLIGVTRLALEPFLFEMDAVAMV